MNVLKIKDCESRYCFGKTKFKFSIVFLSMAIKEGDVPMQVIVARWYEVATDKHVCRIDINVPKKPYAYGIGESSLGGIAWQEESLVKALKSAGVVFEEGETEGVSVVPLLTRLGKELTGHEVFFVTMNP